LIKTRKVILLQSKRYTCSCGKEFEGESHQITLDLGENTRATIDFPLLQDDGEFWEFCPGCLQKHFQEYLNGLNPTQLGFMRDMLTKTATSILKTVGSDVSIGATPAEVVIIDEIRSEE
jgi:hypothetical protein